MSASETGDEAPLVQFFNSVRNSDNASAPASRTVSLSSAASRAQMGMSCGDQPEFARGGAIEQPRGQYPLVDQRDLLHAYALGVEGLRAQAAHPQGIVDDADVLREQLLAHPVFQKAGLARDRGAVDGADEMTDQRCRYPGVVHDRHLAGLDLARISPRHGAFS